MNTDQDSAHKSPRISLLIPVYGVECYIERCARSLFEQTCADIEYIFVDDASEDSSIEVLRNVIADYPERVDNVKIVTHDINRGLLQARLTALGYARGKYVWHIDTDDYISKDAVEKILFTANECDYDAIGFGFRESAGRKDISHCHSNIHDARILSLRQYLRCENFHIWQFAFRRDIFLEIKGYITECIMQEGGAFRRIGFGEDWLLTTAAVSKSRRIGYTEGLLYTYDRGNILSYTSNLTKESILSLESSRQILSKYLESGINGWMYDSAHDSALFNMTVHLWKMTSDNTDLQRSIWPSCLTSAKGKVRMRMLCRNNLPIYVSIRVGIPIMAMLWLRATHIIKRLRGY